MKRGLSRLNISMSHDDISIATLAQWRPFEGSLYIYSPHTGSLLVRPAAGPQCVAA